jgi:hypothetical protein
MVERANTMAKPFPNEPVPGETTDCGDVPVEPVGSDATGPKRDAHRLLDRARERFRELAASCVERCELRPDMARAVLHSLELGFAQTIKEDRPLIERQFDQDVEAAVTWVAERLVESCRHLADDTPGHPRSPLQKLALLEVQALEIMLPEPAVTSVDEPIDHGVPADQLQSFCALLNNGLDCAEMAGAAAAKGEQHAYCRNYALSRVVFRDAARLLRRMLHSVGSETSDLADGLRGFQLELAAHAGSIRMFLRALRAQHAIAQTPQHHAQGIDPHCVVEDLLPTLFDKHFAFTILTPASVDATKSRELVTAAHEMMWRTVGPPVSGLLDQPDELEPAAFKVAVETELGKAIESVNRHFAAERVVIRIRSSNAREIKRGVW